MTHTLLLNANAQPISFLPISAITWQEAIKFVYVDAAEVLHTYDDWEVHSPSMTIKVPSVIILTEQISLARTWSANDIVGPQKHLIFLRDFFTCQYCDGKFPRNKLTIDHVLPRYHGGRTRWDNITTACASCNHRRGHDIRIQPKNKPFRPTYSQLVKNMRKFPVSMPHESWNYYLGWDEDKIRFVNPKNGKIMNEYFDFGIKFNLD